MALFKRVAAMTDIHYGLKHNSKTHNQDCMDFVNWFVAEAKRRECETCIFLGDFHHHRASINISTLYYIYDALAILNSAFEKTYIISGNHDLVYRDKRDLSSMVVTKNFDRIQIVNEPIVEDGVAIVPWLVGEEWKQIKNISARYMFGHFEIPGFKMNASIEMPDGGTVNKDLFKKLEYVFSGHFHKRQQIGNIHYIGNPFGHNFSDVDDPERGAMFFEWGGKPEYVNWEDAPIYTVCTINELVENMSGYLTPKTHIQVIIDDSVSYEILSSLKDLIDNEYPVREIKFINASTHEELEFDGEFCFQSIDHIVIEQLASIESAKFDANRLLDIYRSL